MQIHDDLIDTSGRWALAVGRRIHSVQRAQLIYASKVQAARFIICVTKFLGFDTQFPVYDIRFLFIIQNSTFFTHVGTRPVRRLCCSSRSLLSTKLIT